MKRSENKETKQAEETNEPSRFSSFVYYFDIFYRVVKALVIMLIVLVLVGGSLGAGTAIGYFASLVHGTEIPDHEDMVAQIYDFNQTSTMYYAGGEVISDLRADLMRSPVSLDEMSPLLIDAIVATEDEYFFDHDGIVPKAVARALVQDLTESGASTGGSTLTQQLIKQQLIGAEVSHERKANEILLAMRIENHMDKEEILEAYLNVSPFGRNNKGQNIAGVEEAAQGIFGVPASEVTLPQAAFIAGLPQRPIVFSPYTNSGEIKEDHELSLRRQREVLFRMHREGMISFEEYEEAVEYDLTQDFLNREEMDYEDLSYVYDLGEFEARGILQQYLMENDGITEEDLEENPDLLQEYQEIARYEIRNRGYQIHTTIDRDIHRALETVVEQHVGELGSERTITVTNSDGETEEVTRELQIGGSLIDNKTGRVLGFIGGRDYDYSNHNIAFNMRRSPASVIKPLVVFGPALEQGLITPATIIPDTEYAVPNWDAGSGTFVDHPITNAGPITNEWMTAREALYRSQNIPASKIYMDLIEQVNPGEYMQRMGISENAISMSEYDNASTAIGGTSGGATPTELSSAFSTIANNGNHSEAYVIERIENNEGDVIYEKEVSETEVWSPTTNYLLLDMLRDVHTQGTGQGTMEQLNFNADWISKTGTSQNRNDIWFVGSTPRITLGTWIGYGTSEIPLGDDFGIHPSRRNRNMWARLMNAVYEQNPDAIGAGDTFSRPSEGLTEESVIRATGMKAGEVETPNGDIFSYSGSTHTELFNVNHVPGETVYDFAIGATDEELEEFWSSYASSQSDDDSEDTESDEDDADSESEPDEADEDEDETDSEPEPEPETEEEESSNGNDNGNGNGNGNEDGSSNENANGDDNGNGSSNGNGNGSNNNSEATPPEEPEDEEDNGDDEED